METDDDSFDEDSPQKRKESEMLDESEYDSHPDPFDRFFVIADWQRKLAKLQRTLREKGQAKVQNTFKQGQDRLKEGREGVANKLKMGQAKVVNTFKQGQDRPQSPSRILPQFRTLKLEAQVQAFNVKLEMVMSRMRMKKARQSRHMICFLCSVANLTLLSFWLGRFPHTLHIWYTANAVFLIGCRAVYYKVINEHYFLLDLCYWVHFALLAYIWIFYESEWLFQALQGFAGTCMLSVIAFRNSFVPHSLDRITSFQVHIMPPVMLWVLRWPCTKDEANWPWKIPEERNISVMPSVVLYWCWASGYYTFQYIRREHIERKKRITLFGHIAKEMGVEKMLPAKMQGPVKSRVVFALGHFLAFFACTPCVHLSFWPHTVIMLAAILWGYKNGANFYMTYFWTVYEEQITGFERQMAQAESEMREQKMQQRQQVMEQEEGCDGKAVCDNQPPGEMNDQPPQDKLSGADLGAQDSRDES